MADLRFLLLCLFSLAVTLVQAQEPQQPYRLELPLEINTTDVEVIALPDSSLLLYTKKSNIWGNKADFAVQKYNSKLEEVWHKDYDLEAQDFFMHSYLDGGATYLAFGNIDPQKYKFMRINNATGETTITTHELEAIRGITEFHVLQGRYFLVGVAKNDRNPLLLFVNPENGEAKPLPAIYGYESTFSDIRTNPDHQRVDVVLTEANNRISRLQVKSFDADGNLISNHFILQHDDKNLLNAEVTPGDTTTRMLIGVYGAGSLQLSQGFFTAPVVSHQEANGEFYNFLQLRNSFKYMSPRREERVRRREAERIQSGKQPSYRHKLLLHDLVTTPEGYILTAEAYVTQRRGSGSSFNSLRHNPYTYLSPALSAARDQEEYKHTHAVTLGFDKNGVLLWDNLFVLKDIITPTITKSIETSYTSGGNVVIVYPEEDNIIYHVMDKDKYNDERVELELLTTDKTEKISSTDQLGIIPWYQGSFLAFGFQRLRRGYAESRSTFFINRITF
ncbi:hypothetical protein [Botryobacter ruber]|uniref:hypothetical protein n=1 Tax=Botryobacter ruber TaxID=2171629 RepID=UPI000F6477A5|nr:hypothetical protein [Botryobacter ruber]